ncbi:MAG: PH domain-containing protein [Clostridiaceae bacterium]|nr:PH domain-containing protein [Clostridiaceae bacterium]
MGEQQEIIKMRNHITYVIEQIWGILFILLALIFTNADVVQLREELIQNGDILEGLLAAGGTFVILMLVCLWYINRWYRTTLTVQDGTIRYERKTWMRHVNNLSVIQISNINLEQNLFERVVGTCKVKLDTNSLSTANSTDIQIVLKKRDAENLKQLLVQMIQREAVQEQQEKPDDDHLEYDVTYSAGKIICSGIMGMPAAALLLLIVSGISSCIDAGVLLHLAADEEIYGDLILLGLTGAALVISAVWAIVKCILADFRFRARRERDKVYVSCGFLKKKKYTVPVEKINAVSLRYTFLGRILKRAYVTVINVGGEGEEANGVKLLLMDSYPELEKKMEVLLPEFTLPELDQLKKPPRRYLGLQCLTAALFGAALLFGMQLGLRIAQADQVFPDAASGWFCLGGLLLTVFILFLCFLSYRAAGIYAGERLYLSRGIFSRTILSIPYDRIQYLSMNQGILQRMLGLYGGRISILAGMMNNIQRIGVYGREQYDRLEEKYRQTF